MTKERAYGTKGEFNKVLRPKHTRGLLPEHAQLQAYFARVSTQEGAFSSSLNFPREFAPKYLTG